MNRILIPLALALFTLPLCAQVKGHIQIREDVSGGTSMQLYMDFFPASDVGGIPPIIPAPEDALVIIEPLAGDLTSAGFSGLLSGSMNDQFRLDGLGYKARFRVKDGDLFTYDTVTVSSPLSLQALYISPNSGTPPGTLVTEGSGISFNPNFGNATRRLENAYPGSTNAQLRVNDVDPAIDPRHQVEVFAPGTLKFSFLSGANINQPIAFLLSSFYNPETIPQAFIGFPGSLDIGTHNGLTYQNVVAIADSITGSSGNPFLDQFFFTDQTGRMDFQVSLGSQSRGTSIAAQAIIADPTQMLGLAFTQAADINAAAGKETNLALGDDGGMQVAFEVGSTFDFYGATYTALNINANGFVTLGGGSVSGPSTALIDPQTSLMGTPAIFANWADWDTTGVGVTYREFGREVKISWGRSASPISHAGVADSGSFSLTLILDVPPGTSPRSQNYASDGMGSTASSAGSIFIDVGDLATAMGTLNNFDSVTGVSPGNVMMAASVPNDSFALPSFPQLPNRPNLVQHNLSGTAQSSLNLANGAPALYRNGQQLSGRTTAFFPVPVGPGTSYVSLVDLDQADDLQGANIQNISQSMIGTSSLNFFMIGYFRYLYGNGMGLPGPTAELIDSASMAPLTTLNILSVMTPNGAADAGTLVAAPNTVIPAPGFRPFEGAEVQVPPTALSNPAFIGINAAIRLTFSDGTTLVSRDSIAIVP